MPTIKHWKVVTVCVLAVGLWICWRFVPVVQWTRDFAFAVEERKTSGIILFILAYAVGSVFFIPASLFTVAAGLAFGFIQGALIAGVGATLGAVITFFLARSLLGERVQRWIVRSEKVRALERALAHGGWKVVILFRLTPTVPFAFSNYLFGLTNIRFWPFLIATAIGIVPGSLLHTYLGDVGRDIFIGPTDRTAEEYIFIGFGLLATIALATYIHRLSKKQLDQLRRDEEKSE